MVWRFADRKAEAAERLHNDPPDEYYSSPTRPRRRAFYSAPLRGSPVERRAAAVAGLLVDSTAYLEATVRAAERAAGAKAANANDFFQRRREEARRFAARASEPLLGLESATGGLADELDEEGVEEVDPLAVPARASSGTLDAHMPAEALANLYRAGIPLEAIRIPLRGLPQLGEPIKAWGTSLRTAGRRSNELGARLQHWDIASEES